MAEGVAGSPDYLQRAAANGERFSTFEQLVRTMRDLKALREQTKASIAAIAASVEARQRQLDE